MKDIVMEGNPLGILGFNPRSFGENPNMIRKIKRMTFPIITTMRS
jgi:hypothetical protein